VETGPAASDPKDGKLTVRLTNTIRFIDYNNDAKTDRNQPIGSYCDQDPQRGRRSPACRTAPLAADPQFDELDGRFVRGTA
jgi:hypothetical protein